MASDRFLAYLEAHRPLVEAWIASHAWAADKSQHAAEDLDRYLYAPLFRYNAGAGKRVRPILALVGCEAVGGAPELALASGCAIELFQSAALIHDDIADGGELRRGVPCLHLTEGVGLAINTGDAALIEVAGAILDDEELDARRKLLVLHHITNMERRTLEGQALDLGWVRDGRWDLTTSDYLTMATLKTAHYSAATPLVVGAICGGGSQQQIDALEAIGLDAGLAFQVQDDLLNLVGDAKAQGKDYRSDITEGKRTLVMVRALELLAPRERSELAGILSAGTNDPALLKRAVQLATDCGAIAYAHDYARNLADNAKRKLSNLDIMDEAREVLVSMTDFFVERTS